MATDTQAERCLQACAVYRREVALAQIDMPPGEARLARLAEAVRRGVDQCPVGELQAVHARLTETSAASPAELRRLYGWGLKTHLRHAVLPHQQEVQRRQWATTCVVDEEEIPIRAGFAAMAGETRRDRRAAIETALGAQLARLNPLFEAQCQALWRVAEAFGYPSVEALWSDILPVTPASQQDEVVQILEETQDVYRDLLSWAVKKRLGVPPGQLRRHDILALFTFPDYQSYYQPGALVAGLQTSLQEMGLEPRADGRIVLCHRSPTFGLPEAVAVHIPEEVVVTYSQVSGVQGAEAYAEAYGKALLWAYTSPELPLATRLLGDAAHPVSSAQFVANMVALPGWLRRYLRVRVDAHYRLWRLLDHLYRLRRQLGRFLYSRHLATSGSLGGAQEAYREIMTHACQVEYHPAYYLTDWDWAYTSLRYLRGWKLAALLLATVQQRFAEDWFRNPDAGVWLRHYWHDALGERVETLLQNLGEVPWEVPGFIDTLLNIASPS